MIINGKFELFGIQCETTMVIDNNDAARGVVTKYKDRFQVYVYENGKQRHLGYYSNSDEARQAATVCRNLSRYRRDMLKRAEATIRRTDDGTWQVWCRGVMWPCRSFGDAVLRYDILARIHSLPVLVEDYAMPFGMIDNDEVLARVNEPAFDPTDAELKRYAAIVDALNNATL